MKDGISRLNCPGIPERKCVALKAWIREGQPRDIGDEEEARDEEYASNLFELMNKT